MGAKNLSPVNRTACGIEEDAGPFLGSGLIEYDFGLPALPKTNIPTTEPEEDDPHDEVRKLDASRHATDQFLRYGLVKAYCEGVCDPDWPAQTPVVPVLAVPVPLPVPASVGVAAPLAPSADERARALHRT